MADAPSAPIPKGELAFSYGFGSAVLFHGNDQRRPRLALKFNGSGLALSVVVPDQPHDDVASVYLGIERICSVRTDGSTRRYILEPRVEAVLLNKPSYLIAQLSTLVNEAILAKAIHNPTDYAGTVPLGVSPC